jgi:transposase
MIIIGVDFHPEFQRIAWVDTDTGEFLEKRLAHREEAEKFYRGLAAAGQKVRVGMEAGGHARWFERLLPRFRLSCGLETRPRSEPSGYASRRRIGKTRS